MKSLIQHIKYIEQMLLWSFMFLFVIDYHFWQDNYFEAIGKTLLELSTYAFVFYMNYKILIPFLLAKEKRLLYGFSLLVLVILYISCIRFSGIENHLYEGNGWRNIFSMLINTFLFILLSSFFWFYKSFQMEKERKMKLKTEKLETELKFLKAQISPHFIFNSLNNIYALVLQQHKNAAPMVAGLSKIMRYILYDCSEDEVLLEKELEHIQNYINLQLLKMPASENIDFYTEGNFQGITIAPLILINFVENSFKHSNIDNDENAWIKIEALMKESNVFHFRIHNSKGVQSVNIKDGGIGLVNTKQQLNLHYPEKHGLEISENPEDFEIELSIKQLGMSTK